jgi:hypothetical protein
MERAARGGDIYSHVQVRNEVDDVMSEHYALLSTLTVILAILLQAGNKR